MNLVIILPWIQVSFECYVSIRISYVGKKQGFSVKLYVVLVRDLKKQNLVGKTVCEEVVNIRGLCYSMGDKGVNVTWEFTERKDHVVAQMIEKYIIGLKLKFRNNQHESERVGMPCCCVDFQGMFWSSIMLSASPTPIEQSCQRGERRIVQLLWVCLPVDVYRCM